MTLTEFLLARIAEDEAVAVAVRDGHDPFDWTNAEGLPAVGMADSDGPSGYGVAIIDPARVLAECEAKRRIVDYREQAARSSRDTGLPIFEAQVSAYDASLRALALPYADRADFQEEWRP